MDRLADLVPQSLPNQAVRLFATDVVFHRPDQGIEDLRLDLGSFEQREFRFIAHAHDRTAFSPGPGRRSVADRQLRRSRRPTSERRLCRPLCGVGLSVRGAVEVG